MSEFGILIAEDGSNIREGRNKLDSRRRTLILDLEADPAHMQIIEVTGGNAYTDSGGTDRSSDLLYTMKHNLNFVPLVDCYFYVQSYDGNSSTSPAGGYAGEFYPMSGSAGTVSDFISYEVDKTEIRLVHYFDRFGFTTGYTSDAPKYRFKVKFYIYSIDIGRDVNYGYGF
jgi:hypothetical protein